MLRVTLSVYRLAVVGFRSWQNFMAEETKADSLGKRTGPEQHGGRSSGYLSGNGPLTALLTVGLLFCAASPALAVSCTPQSRIAEVDRNVLAQSAKSLAALVQSGDSVALKKKTISSVAERFDSIAAAVEAASPQIQRATITTEALYQLDSTDLKRTEDETQFFCGAGDSHEVVLTIPNIPPGHYAIALLQATGVESPQSLAFILSRGGTNTGDWLLAGCFIHPLTSAGRHGTWYWTQARALARKEQRWNAYFYYQTAAYLLNPVYFLSSPNFDKLLKEQSAIAPPGLPNSNQPMVLNFSGQVFEIQDIHTDSSLGGLDLVINYKAQSTSDPVAARTRNVDLMKLLLAQHPELKEGFHGLWAYANVPDQQPFANELPMGQIQ